jgi:hypothetical protein
MADKILKKMIKASEIGGTKHISKKKAKRGNVMGKQIKAKKGRYSTADL